MKKYVSFSLQILHLHFQRQTFVDKLPFFSFSIQFVYKYSHVVMNINLLLNESIIKVKMGCFGHFLLQIVLQQIFMQA